MIVRYTQIQIDYKDAEEFNSHSESMALTGWRLTRKYPPRKAGEGPVTIWVTDVEQTPLYERIRELELALHFLLGYEDEILDCLSNGGVSEKPEVEQRCAAYRKLLGMEP